MRPPGLRAFARITDLWRVSATARALGVPESRVSRAFPKPERIVGAIPVDRSARHLRLTDAGSPLRPHALPILADVHEGRDRARRSRRRTGWHAPGPSAVHGRDRAGGPHVPEFIRAHPPNPCDSDGREPLHRHARRIGGSRHARRTGDGRPERSTRRSRTDRATAICRRIELGCPATAGAKQRRHRAPARLPRSAISRGWPVNSAVARD